MVWTTSRSFRPPSAPPSGLPTSIWRTASHAGHNTLGSFAHDDVVRASLERVPIEPLDAVIARLALARVDFVKIDVEGAEASVIAGAATVLNSMRPLMLIEVNDKALRAQGNCADSLMATLRDELRYEIFVFSPVTGLLERPIDGHPLSANVVAIPGERVADTVTAA